MSNSLDGNEMFFDAIEDGELAMQIDADVDSAFANVGLTGN